MAKTLFKMPLTDEQKLRMEENRRKAMEKRQQANQAEPTISNETKSLNVTEQKLRMEENRRKALEIRLQREKDKFINQNDQAITVVENKPAMSTGISTTSFYDSEKKRRMEENKRKALEIRQQKLLQENSQLNQTQSTSADAPKKLSESEQKMRPRTGFLGLDSEI